MKVLDLLAAIEKEKHRQQVEKKLCSCSLGELHKKNFHTIEYYGSCTLKCPCALIIIQRESFRRNQEE
jgi:hypothetical protein